jgi:hypothetical protein
MCTGDPDRPVKSVPAAGFTPSPVKKLSLTTENQNCEARPSAMRPPMRAMKPMTSLNESARFCRSSSWSVENVN